MWELINRCNSFKLSPWNFVQEQISASLHLLLLSRLIPQERLSSSTGSGAPLPAHVKQLSALDLNSDQTALVLEAYSKHYLVNDEPGTVRCLLRVLYQLVNPAKVSEVDTLIAKYAGRKVLCLKKSCC